MGREMGRASGRLQNSSDLRSSRLVFKMSQFKLALVVIILFGREKLELQAEIDLGSNSGSAGYSPLCPWQVT